MKVPAFVPSVSEIAREALIVLAGALVAALIIGQLPSVKLWVKEQWT